MDRSAEKYAQQLEASRAWKKANKERHAELARAYRARNNEKTNAQNALNYAIARGELSRGDCEKCGTNVRVHAHHDDYNKPLQVRWLCYLCHKAEHPVDEEDKKVKFAGAKKAVLLGSENPNARLTDKCVRQIRMALLIGISQEKIGKAFDVDQVTISRIHRRESYSEVE